jgi:hypothetical protein
VLFIVSSNVCNKRHATRPTHVILVTLEAEIRRIGFQSQPPANSSQDAVLKIPNTKMAGGVAEVVEHLSSKCEAEFKPSTTHTQKTKPTEKHM